MIISNLDKGELTFFCFFSKTGKNELTFGKIRNKQEKMSSPSEKLEINRRK